MHRLVACALGKLQSGLKRNSCFPPQQEIGNITELIASIDKIKLNASSNLEARNTDGNTAFLLAAKNGHDKVASTLHERGADRNAQNSANEMFLHLAVKFNHTDVVEKILIPQTAKQFSFKSSS